MQTAQEKAIAEIRAVGGEVQLDETLPDQPVVLVKLNNDKVTDATLACVRAFPNLQRLNLGFSLVTAAGLEHLSGLSELQHLDLRNTAITDPGLGHLKGLSQLQKLLLWHTKITAVAVRELQKLLPKTTILR